MFRNDGNPGMGLSVVAGPAVLFKPAHYPDAPAFASQVVTIFRQFRPGFYVEESHFPFQLGILFVKPVGSQSKGAQGRSFRGGTKEGISHEVSLDEDTVEIVHYMPPHTLKSERPKPPGMDFHAALYTALEWKALLSFEKKQKKYDKSHIFFGFLSCQKQYCLS
jgi:hypothetical protein